TAHAFYVSLLGGRGFQAMRGMPPSYALATLAIACAIAMLPKNSNRIAAEMSFGWPLQAATALLLAAGILSVGNPTEFLYFNF
ncbi:MAG: hypothetical protein ABI789_06795, partial [Usitatibacter sp.]